MNRLSLLALAMLTCGCMTNRSISSYSRGYNSAYVGELSQVEFVKDVASKTSKPAPARVTVSHHDTVMLMQSGQVRPDRSLASQFPSSVALVPFSGVPSRYGNSDLSLRDAAAAGGMTKIIAFWGNIQNTSAGTVVVTLSVIVSDVKSGQWSLYSVASSEVRKAKSFLNPKRADDLQVQSLKAEAYTELLEHLIVG